MSLTDNQSSVTAISNDTFDELFTNQLKFILKKVIKF